MITSTEWSSGWASFLNRSANRPPSTRGNSFCTITPSAPPHTQISTTFLILRIKRAHNYGWLFKAPTTARTAAVEANVHLKRISRHSAQCTAAHQDDTFSPAPTLCTNNAIRFLIALGVKFGTLKTEESNERIPSPRLPWIGFRIARPREA